MKLAWPSGNSKILIFGKKKLDTSQFGETESGCKCSKKSA
jgi:hypothetical protein